MEINTAFALVAVLVVCFCENVTTDSDEMDSISEFCKVQENATDADMKMWKSDAEPKPRTVKCLDACVGEKMGMMINNKLNVDGAMRNYASENKDEKAQAIIKEVLIECKEVTDADRCEASAKILQCVHNGTRNRHMKEM